MRELTTEEHKQFNEIFENLGALWMCLNQDMTSW